MKFIKVLIFIVLLMSISTSSVSAIYDPTLKPNNKFGIHILFPSETSEAAHLVNSTGGDWGYVTIPIQASDKNLKKWQDFMNDCQKYHVIPIIRLATTGDYFDKASWSKPTEYDILDFANFLNDLKWPTKNRYIIVFNETNRGDEYGGIPDPIDYANILNYAVDAFKQKSEDFFIISSGFDNASINIPGQSYKDATYMNLMENAIPGIFSKIDGIASHSYPNPAFSMPPSRSKVSIYSFYYQQELARQLSGKNLPVFITETGWSSDKVSKEQQAQYYIQAFSNYWNSEDIVAVTPFIFNSAGGPFAQFSFLTEGNKNNIYYAYFNIKKNKGEPQTTPIIIKDTQENESFPTKHFKSTSIESIFKSLGTSKTTFFKWLLKF